MGEVARIEGAAVPEEGHAVRVVVSGNPVAVFRVGGTFYALDARGTHVGGPLDMGRIEGFHVTCPWHHSVFDLRDGSVVQGPAVRPVLAYRVRLDGTTLVLEKA